MATACVDDCGLTVVNGLVAVDWNDIGDVSVCGTSELYSSENPGGHADWSGMRNIVLTWTNNTCRKHLVTARLDVPWVRMRVGNGNVWFVRGDLRAGLNGLPDPETLSLPDLQWQAQWSNLLTAGTDSTTMTPGSCEHEYYVPSGETLTAQARLMVREVLYTSRPSNLLEAAPMRLTLKARPSKDSGTVGELC